MACQTPSIGKMEVLLRDLETWALIPASATDSLCDLRQVT